MLEENRGPLSKKFENRWFKEVAVFRPLTLITLPTYPWYPFSHPFSNAWFYTLCKCVDISLPIRVGNALVPSSILPARISLFYDKVLF